MPCTKTTTYMDVSPKFADPGDMGCCSAQEDNCDVWSGQAEVASGYGGLEKG